MRMAGEKRGRTGKPPHRRWLDSYPTCSKWFTQWDLQSLLDAGNGLAKIKGIFPPHVALGILEDLQGLQQWNETSAEADYEHNNIRHSFWSVRHASELQAPVRALSLLLPEALHSFSAAKYIRNDGIEAHDDRAYTQVLMEDGSMVTCSRDIALICYFTESWTAEDGGLLIDLEGERGPRTYIPEFNSAICFRIPRWHLVTPMVTDRPRFTIFGWFLIPGHLYDLQLTQPPSSEPQSQPGKLHSALPGKSVRAVKASKDGSLHCESVWRRLGEGDGAGVLETGESSEGASEPYERRKGRRGRLGIKGSGEGEVREEVAQGRGKVQAKSDMACEIKGENLEGGLPICPTHVREAPEQMPTGGGQKAVSMPVLLSEGGPAGRKREGSRGLVTVQQRSRKRVTGKDGAGGGGNGKKSNDNGKDAWDPDGGSLGLVRIKRGP